MRRRRRRRHGISPLGLSLASSTFHSDVDDEPVEVEFGFAGSCLGVCGDCCFVDVVERRCSCRVSAWLRRKLWVMWTAGERIDLDFSSATVDDERRFEICKAWGASPGRCSFNGGIGPAFVSGSYCGSLKPACDGASSDRGGGDGGCGGGFVRCRCWKGKGPGTYL